MHSTEFAIVEALERPVCVVCHLAQASACAYLKGVLAEGVNDPRLRADWRRRGGPCSRHWRVLRELDHSALPAAIVSEDLLRTYLTTGMPLPPDCAACEVERRAEARYLKALQHMKRDVVLGALAEGPGFLCLRHLPSLRSDGLSGAFRAKLTALLIELREFERKQDYRFAAEPPGPERDSWLRAVRALGGEL